MLSSKFSIDFYKERGQSKTFLIKGSDGNPIYIAKFLDFLKGVNFEFKTETFDLYQNLDELINDLEEFEESSNDIEETINAIELNKRCFERYKVVGEVEHLDCFPKLLFSQVIKMQNSFYGVLIEDFVDGITLEELLQSDIGNRLEFVFDFLNQMSIFLINMGKHGIVHRDLSPDNIMMYSNNKYILIDPGVIKIEDNNMTKSRMILGKKHYASPEQYMGNARLATFKSDLYSLGIIALEIITGKKYLQSYIQMGCSEPHKKIVSSFGRSIEDDIFKKIEENSFSKKLVLIIEKMIQINDLKRFDSIETFQKTLSLIKVGGGSNQ